MSRTRSEVLGHPGTEMFGVSERSDSLEMGRFLVPEPSSSRSPSMARLELEQYFGYGATSSMSDEIGV